MQCPVFLLYLHYYTEVVKIVLYCLFYFYVTCQKLITMMWPAGRSLRLSVPLDTLKLETTDTTDQESR